MVSSSKKRIIIRKRGQIIAIDRKGLAWSAQDLLDAVGPAIPSLLAFAPTTNTECAVQEYLLVKCSRNYTEIQLFPRLESLETWMALRAEGLNGLCPDEALVLKQLLDGTRSKLLCISSRPSENSSMLQIGRRQYFESLLPVAEFLDSLGTIESDTKGMAPCYIPRDSVLLVKGVVRNPTVSSWELGEWFFA